MSTLTPRQEQTLNMFTAGYTTRETAWQLGLSIETIRWHTKQAYIALNVHNRADALAALQRSKTHCLLCGQPLRAHDA
jgi:DNA-binding CsgD family transcriptional regulator